MTGRARGRSRGRGRTDAPPPGAGGVARRPGEAAAATPILRNGTRGPPPVVLQHATAAAPLTAAMENMAIEESSRRGPRVNSGALPEYLPTGQSKMGSTGTRVLLATNSFMLERQPNYMLYQYHVAFSPEVDFKKVRLGLIADQQQLLGSVRAFDGMTLFLPIRLPDRVTKVVGRRRRRDNPEGEPVEITITLTSEIPEFSPTSTQLYNIVLKSILKIRKMQRVGRDYFFPDLAVDFPRHHLEIWPGFKTSIKKYEAGFLLNVDVDHKILRNRTVLDIMYEMHGRDQRNFHANAKKKLIGQIVLTRYNNKTYRVDDIDWDLRPHHTFPTPSGDISYVDYYTKKYDRQITDMEQPMLLSKPKKMFGRNSGPDDKIYLLPELCYLTGLDDEMRNDFNLMKDVNTCTRLLPRDRGSELKTFINSINSNEEASRKLEGWGLQFGSSLLQLQGRVLPPEKLFQRGRQLSYGTRNAEWSREMRGNPLHSSVNMESWMLVYPVREANLANDLFSSLRTVCEPMGMRVSRPKMIALENDRTETYLRTMRAELERDWPQAVLVLSSSSRKDHYDAIKRLFCLEKPVPSQVVLKRTLDKRPMLLSVCTKIGIQLNCKLGGEAWASDIPLRGLMVIGIDTYHDSVEKGRSVGGFVASINPSLTRYFSKCTFQHRGQELIDGLKVCMTAALRKYQEVNGTFPERIILYRDGVGDGQLQAVKEHEVSQLIDSFNCFPGVEYRPSFAVIIVTKRINTRLLLKDPRDTNMTNLNNPPPGTVVDTAVTNPDWFDFFLVSQSVRQGTVTPVHFNVIHNTFSPSVLTPDRFQRLSYKLTHLYYNWPGTVRVPAPCQYAHKLAFLVGQSLHQEPHASLSDKLFFL